MDAIASLEKQKVAISSVIAAVFLTVLKLIVGLMTGSLGILSEAAHSGLDLVAAALTYFAVKIADKPADREHTYGHGKFENLSALFETLLLVVTCGWIIYEAVNRIFFHEVHIEVNFWSFAVIVTAIIVDYSRSRILFKAAKKYNSQALEADALHFSTDILSSGVVIVGLIGAGFGFHKADAFAALVVSGIVMWISFRLGKRTIDMLTDRIPDVGLVDKVREEVLKIDGVVNCRNIRIRQAGSKSFVDMVVDIKRTIPFEQAHQIMNLIEERIKKMMQNVDIVIHAEPIETDDETVIDKIRMILIHSGMSAHNIEVQKVKDRYFVDLHLECKEKQTLEEAHEIANQIEDAIKNKIENVERISIHIDEESDMIKETKIVNDRCEDMVQRIVSIARSHKGVIDCKDITVMEIDGKYKVTMNCLLDKSLTLSEAHEIATTIENQIYLDIKEVSKVIVHAEPENKT
ncbi:cation diffusion facilitator family transporter [Candidatus Thermokryptus mobilis]|uniref:Cation diffusion facilitator family transporter n=1 Tax=Candidatus Thermokryptus mobilis TaxID=1643428 RepID=A0A0S4MUL7_9BACT|nr:cation-efflux pump [Candidatus Thermokryptus mobilis]CUU02437.1 cation diffusion facilitator family transporter [Candidatus Thermokryptus mobilis]